MLFWLLMPALMAAELGSGKIPETNLSVAIATDGAGPVPVNKMLTVRLKFSADPATNPAKVAAPAITDVAFDARMPEHNHGMLTKPRVRVVDDKNYHVDGVKLHMPGNWELRVTLRVNGQPRSVVIPLKL